MYYSKTRLVLVVGAALIAATPATFAQTQKRASSPTVITPPAVQDGSNRARAPFIAERRQDDVTPPNGQAIDQDVPPNTPSTSPEPFAPPAATVAIMQPAVDPGTLPTGLPTVGAAASLDAARVGTTIQSASFETRDELVDNVRMRMRQSEDALSSFRRSRSQMSAEGRTQFDAAVDAVQAAEKNLDKSIRAASRASSATWEQARAQLAADYDAYAAALARIDASAGIAPAR